MENLKNYLKYFKDVTFEESAFNDIDNAIFASLIYLDFSKILKRPMSMKELGKKFFNEIDYKKVKSSPIIVRRTIDNFEVLFNSDRYKDIIVSNYEKIVDFEKQFGAIKFKHELFTYVAYEGTDDSLIGWKEDFDMIHTFPVPSQKMAINYLNKVINFSDKKIYVGGHSKGGNLAMTASMYANYFVRRKIVKVYNNDGPGFMESELQSRAYKKMLPKLVTIVPEESMVGILFGSLKEPRVIVSSGKGIFQHNINNWNCYGPIFLKGNLSDNSKMIKMRVDKWLKKHNNDERKKMVDALFEMLKASDITSIKQGQFGVPKMLKMLRQTKDMDKESRDLILEVMKVIFTKGDV